MESRAGFFSGSQLNNQFFMVHVRAFRGSGMEYPNLSISSDHQAGAAGPELAAAVSNAGGLGNIGILSS